jgi:hypothetical protein
LRRACPGEGILGQEGGPDHALGEDAFSLAGRCTTKLKLNPLASSDMIRAISLPLPMDLIRPPKKRLIRLCRFSSISRTGWRVANPDRSVSSCASAGTAPRNSRTENALWNVCHLQNLAPRPCFSRHFGPGPRM